MATWAGRCHAHAARSAGPDRARELTGRSFLPLLLGEQPDAPRYTVSGFMQGWRTLTVADGARGTRRLAHAAVRSGARSRRACGLAADRPIAVRYARALLGLALDARSPSSPPRCPPKPRLWMPPRWRSCTRWASDPFRTLSHAAHATAPSHRAMYKLLAARRPESRAIGCSRCAVSRLHRVLLGRYSPLELLYDGDSYFILPPHARSAARHVAFAAVGALQRHARGLRRHPLALQESLDSDFLAFARSTAPQLARRVQQDPRLTACCLEHPALPRAAQSQRRLRARLAVALDDPPRNDPARASTLLSAAALALTLQLAGAAAAAPTEKDRAAVAAAARAPAGCRRIAEQPRPLVAARWLGAAAASARQRRPLEHAGGSGSS